LQAVTRAAEEESRIAWKMAARQIVGAMRRIALGAETPPRPYNRRPTADLAV